MTNSDAVDDVPVFEKLRRKIVTGWLQLFSGSLLASLLNFVSFILLTRSVSVEMVGLVAVIQTYWRLIEGLLAFRSFTILISFGARSIARRDTDEFKQVFRICFGADLAVGLCGVAIGIAGLLLFSAKLNIPAEDVSLAAIGSLMMIHTVTGASAGALRLFDRFHLVALAEVLIAVIRVSLALVGFFAGYSAGYFLISWVVAQVIGDLLLIVMGIRAIGAEGYKGWFWTPSPPRGFTSDVLRSLLVVNVTSTVNILSEEGDVMLVNTLLGAAAAGKYKLAKNFAGIIHRISKPLHEVIYPEIARLITAGHKDVYYRLARNVNIGCGAVALAGVAGWLVLGKLILHYTVGPDFIDTYSTIAILLIAIAAAWFGLVFTPTLLALQRWREIFAIKLTCTAIFFAGAAILIPQFGINGAAMAQLICYAAEVGFAFAVIHYALKPSETEQPLPQGR